MYFTNTKELQKFEKEMKTVPGFDRKSDDENTMEDKKYDKNEDELL